MANTTMSSNRWYLDRMVRVINIVTLGEVNESYDDDPEKVREEMDRLGKIYNALAALWEEVLVAAPLEAFWPFSTPIDKQEAKWAKRNAVDECWVNFMPARVDDNRSPLNMCLGIVREYGVPAPDFANIARALDAGVPLADILA